MKALLLALAAYLSARNGAGLVYWTSASYAGETGLEIVDRNSCSVSNCGAAQCVQANNILADAGSACTVKFVDCGLRINATARDMAADAGLIFPSGSYQQARFIAMRCGNALGVPVTDAGWPIYTATSQPFPCAWSNPDSGVCTGIDGGAVENFLTLRAGEFSGSCQRKSCFEFAGDSSAP